MPSFNTPPNLTATQTLGGNDIGTVGANSSVVTGGVAISVALATAPPGGTPYTGVVINNAGLIQSTGGRAIDTVGTPGLAFRMLKITNGQDATITSPNDAIRLNTDLVVGDSLVVDNAGTISSTGTGQAIDFNTLETSGTFPLIVNRASGTIRSSDNDAIRPGEGGRVDNSGAIIANAAVPNADQPNADAIDYQEDQAGEVRNFLLISGARHGIAGGTGSVVTVDNQAAGTILGRNGSGVGLDELGGVFNRGTITGTVDSTSGRGDGDGVDIDFTATVINFGTIQGLGAKGLDSGGRGNAAEGISIGGGTIENRGVIRSSTTSQSGTNTFTTGGAIVANNDANVSRSGSASTTILNATGALIASDAGYAIRLENKGNAAISTDSITNFGTISGAGTITDPNSVATYVDPNDGVTKADPNSVGTLDGVNYTGTGSARFIRGDGAAIQMGEGNDSLVNYGSITGNTGRAISLEGGLDSLSIYTGSTIAGRIDGGAGADTLTLRTDDRTGANPDAGGNSGAVTGSLSNVIGFETLQVVGGSWTIADAQAYTTSTVATGSALIVTSAGSLSGSLSLAGTLTMDGTSAGLVVTVASGGILNGEGTTGAVQVLAGGTFSPGNAQGILLTGDLTLAANATFIQQIGGTAPGAGYDQTLVTGAVALGGARLDLTALGGFIPSAGSTFTLIQNDGADAVVGTFSDTGGTALAEGATVQFGGRAFVVSYIGGDGNDVTLRSGVAPSVAIAIIAGDDVLNGAEAQAAITITGTTTGIEDGQVVTVAVKNAAGNTTFASSTATVTNGAWSLSLPAGTGTQLPDRTYLVTADVTDRGGNAAPAAQRSLLVDKFADQPPSATLAVNATPDGVINAAEAGAVAFTVAGLDGDATASARFNDGVRTASAAVAANGTFTIDLSGFSGSTTASLVITDVNGNTAAAAGNAVALDTTAPASPAAPVLANDTGAPGDRLTRDAAIVYPTSGPGDTLLYSLDGAAFGATAPVLATDGSADGPHVVTIQARDAAGNGSGLSSLAFTLDTVAPTLAVTGVSGPSNVVSHVVSGTLGAPDAGGLVTVRDGATLLGTVTSDSQGSWALPFTYEGAGNDVYQLTASATDAAGNAGLSAVFDFVLDFTPNRGAFGTVVSDTSGAGGQVFELFAGLLGRTPDPLGFEAAIEALSNGGSLASLARDFLGSSEYTATNGPISAETDAAFVSELYQVVLGRAGDASGAAFWTEALGFGATRGEVAASFALSSENLAQDAAVLGAGVFAPDPVASDVARLYYGVLDRAPDASGLAFWSDAIRSGGASETTVAAGFLASGEYAASRGATPTTAQFINGLYDGALGRAPDADGLAFWQSALDGGATRADVAVGISASLEGQFTHVGDIEQGWHLA